MKTYFTSDWHLNDDRFNIMFRSFESVDENDKTILDNFKANFKNGDTLFHLGDVIYSLDNGGQERYNKLFKDLKKSYDKSKFVLILGNYDVDDDKKMPILRELFDETWNFLKIKAKDQKLYLNHYPKKVRKAINENKEKLFGITGHIHSLWKVQEDMINVGVDAWNYLPIELEQIDFTINGIQNHYDDNVFLK